MPAIGLAAVDRMRAQGMTDQQIKDSGFTFGEAAVASLGSGATAAPAGATSSSAIGQAQVDRMRAAGATDEQIKNSGFNFGEVAASNLGVPTYNPSSSVSTGWNPSMASTDIGKGGKAWQGKNSGQYLDMDQYRGDLSDRSSGKIGQAAIDRARADGWEDWDIAAALSADKIMLGDNARIYSTDAGSGTGYQIRQFWDDDTQSLYYAAGPKIDDAWNAGIRDYKSMRSYGTSLDTKPSSSSTSSKKSTASEMLKELATPETIFTPDISGFDTVPTNTEKSVIYTDENTNAIDPWDFEYGSNKTSAITNNAFENINSFAPAPLPAIEKKKSIFEEVMNSVPASSASPQTFANIIANT